MLWGNNIGLSRLMPTVHLLPNSTISNEWDRDPAFGFPHTMLDDNHSGTILSDSSELRTSVVGEVFEVGFADFTESFSSIDNIQAVVVAGNPSRGGSFTIKTFINDNSGSNYYTENSVSLSASGTYRTITYTARTTSDGSDAWTNSELNNLQLKVEAEAISTGTVYCTFCYIAVTYTAVTSTSNAILMGTNF